MGFWLGFYLGTQGVGDFMRLCDMCDGFMDEVRWQVDGSIDLILCCDLSGGESDDCKCDGSCDKSSNWRRSESDDRKSYINPSNIRRQKGEAQYSTP